MRRVVKKVWIYFSSVLTVFGLIYLGLHIFSIPLFEENSTTLVLPTREAQIATAKALSAALGLPVRELNTPDVKRFLFSDGTSVDFVERFNSSELMYRLTSLKQIILPLFSSVSPIDFSYEMAESLRRAGFKVQVIDHPDSAFEREKIIIVLSEAFKTDDDSGFGVLIRYPALFVGGPRPTPFTGWPN